MKVLETLWTMFKFNSNNIIDNMFVEQPSLSKVLVFINNASMNASLCFFFSLEEKSQFVIVIYD